MKLTDKKVIGSIVVLTVLLASGAYFYYGDVQRIWEACLAENPDLEYCVYSVIRDDKGITQVELLTHNITTEDPNDFVRWRLDRDELTVYNGYFIGAEAKWYVDYFKTYGEDEWVNLRRKSTKIDLEIEKFDTYVILRKTTEYYAYASLSGTGGWLVEEIMVGQNWHKYSAKWVPANNRMSTEHRLRWKVGSFDIGSEPPRTLKNEYTLNFGRSVIVNWLDDKEDVEFANLTAKNLELKFIAKRGVYEINSPSIGIGTAKNDWFSLERNTDQCLGRCEAIFKICNPTPAKITTASKEDFSMEFAKRSVDSSNLKDWRIEVERTQYVEYPIYDYKEVCEKIDVNKDGIDCWQEPYVDSYKIRELKRWEEVGLNEIEIGKGECARVKLVGFKEPKLGENDVDWIPTVGGFRITEHAWWNADWTKRRCVRVTPGMDVNINTMIKVKDIDVSGWGLTTLNEIRVVNEDTSVELDRNVMGSTTSTDLNIYFQSDESLRIGTVYNTKFRVYYGNSSVTTSPDLNRTQSIESWADNNFTNPLWVTNPGDSGQGAISSTQAYADTYSLFYDVENNAAWYGDITYLSDDWNYDAEQRWSTWFWSGTTVANSNVFGLYTADTNFVEIGFTTAVGEIYISTSTEGAFQWNPAMGNWAGKWTQVIVQYAPSDGNLYVTIRDDNSGMKAYNYKATVGMVFDRVITRSRGQGGGAGSKHFYDYISVGGYVLATGLGNQEMNLDSDPPTITIFNPTRERWVNETVLIDVSVYDGNAIKSAWIDANVADNCFADQNVVIGDNNLTWNSANASCLDVFDINMTAYALDYNESGKMVTSVSVEYHVDNEAPVTLNNTDKEWYTADINVLFECTDAGSDCNMFYYYLDDANYSRGWGDINIGVNVTGDGNNEIIYWSGDGVDNNEALKFAWALKDVSDPIVNIVKPEDENGWYDDTIVSFDLNDGSSGIDIATARVDINGVTSTDFDWETDCVRVDYNWYCSYSETLFDTNALDYNVTVWADDNVGRQDHNTHQFKWIVSPSILWGNVNDFYASDDSGIDLYLGSLVDYNVTPVGQSDTNGIFNVYNNVNDGTSAVHVYLDLNMALPNDSVLVACTQKDRVTTTGSSLCWDINSSMKARIVANLAYDANQMFWWFFDVNVVGVEGYEFIVDYQYEARFA